MIVNYLTYNHQTSEAITGVPGYSTVYNDVEYVDIQKPIPDMEIRNDINYMSIKSDNPFPIRINERNGYLTIEI